MKNLILVRHAKSNWNDMVCDKDRTISNRGTSDAHLVSSNVMNYLPHKFTVFTSTAIRAKETATIFVQNWIFPLGSIIQNEELYTFDANVLETAIKSISDDYENVILFGHNAALTDFVNKFGDILIDNVPTSGFVSINFESLNWKIISKGTTIKIVFPRDLKL